MTDIEVIFMTWTMNSALVLDSSVCFSLHWATSFKNKPSADKEIYREQKLLSQLFIWDQILWTKLSSSKRFSKQFIYFNMVQAFWSFTVAYVHRALTEGEEKGLEVTFHACLEIRIEHPLEVKFYEDALGCTGLL